MSDFPCHDCIARECDNDASFICPFLEEYSKIKPECKNCIEWEYFEGYGYGCFVGQTMKPIDATKCEFYHYYKR